MISKNGKDSDKFGFFIKYSNLPISINFENENF